MDNSCSIHGNSCVPIPAVAPTRSLSVASEQSSSACFYKTYNYHELNTNCHKLFLFSYFNIGQ